MCGPQASATPQCAMAHAGSSRAASWNERIAIAVIEPKEKVEPLVEVALSFRRTRGDLAHMGTEAFDQRYGFRLDRLLRGRRGK